jgi:hypothetical protein
MAAPDRSKSRHDHEEAGRARMNVPEALRRFGWAAAALVALAAYAFFYLSSVPQAWSVEEDSQGRWEAKGQDQLQLLVPTGGPLFTAEVGCAGNLELRTFAGPGAGSQSARIISIAKGGGASLGLALAPDPAAGGSASVVLEGIRQDPDYPKVRLLAQHAHLYIDAFAIPAPGTPPAAPVQFSTDRLEIVFPCPQTEGPEGVRLDLGDIKDVDRPAVLALQGVAIGQINDGGVFDRDSLVCGSRKGRRVWRLPIPSVEPADCQPGHLWASDLRIRKSLSMTLQGSAFTSRDGKAHVWPFVDEVMNNPVLKFAIEAGIAALVAGVGFNLHRQRAQAKKKAESADT